MTTSILNSITLAGAYTTAMETALCQDRKAMKHSAARAPRRASWLGHLAGYLRTIAKRSAAART